MNSSEFTTINPATDERIEKFAYFTPKETEAELSSFGLLAFVNAQTVWIQN